MNKMNENTRFSNEGIPPKA